MTTVSGVIKIESNKIEAVVKKIQKISETLSSEDKDIVLIAPVKLRHVIYLVLSQLVTNIRVIAREELMFEYPLNVIGKI